MPHSRDIIGRLRFAAIDFESAGAARGDTDQPVQIGIAACSSLEAEPELWTSYIATDRPVLWSASQVHGITTEMLADAPPFHALWPDIRSRLGGAVVATIRPRRGSSCGGFRDTDLVPGWILWFWGRCAFPGCRIIPCPPCVMPSE